MGLVDSVKTPCSSTQGGAALTVADITGFSPGDALLVIQVQGAGAGAWEERFVDSVAGSTIALAQPLANTYLSDATDAAFVLRIPQYRSATIQAGGVLTASAWNGSVGGIVAFYSQTTVDNEGTIRADGLGFRGGAAGTVERYTTDTGGPFGGESFTGLSMRSPIIVAAGSNMVPQPNGGGGAGGISPSGEGMTGGSGGSYGTSGRIGKTAANTTSQLIPSATYGDLDLSTLFMGSGGGAGSNAFAPGGGVAQSGGTGGNGGGIILVRAGSLINRGVFSAAGTNGDYGASPGTGAAYISGGGGGGGSGGSVLIGAMSGTRGATSVSGGRGGQAGTNPYGGWTAEPDGGDGGDGRVNLRVGSGYSLVLSDANNVQLISNGPTSAAMIVVKK